VVKRLLFFSILLVGILFTYFLYNKGLIGTGSGPQALDSHNSAKDNFNSTVNALSNDSAKTNLADAAKKNLPELRIYTYSSFATAWGPGPKLKEAFEQECNCIVKWLTANDSRTIIQRLELQRNSEPADLILGLDFFDTKIASERLKIKNSSVPVMSSIPWSEVILKNGLNDPWVPFDWGYLTFNTHNDEVLFANTKKLDDLLDPRLKNSLAIEDPRTSSPGLLFLFWIFTTKGEKKALEFYKKLTPNIHSYGSSWSTSYGLFTEGQAKAVFSYTTSPVYHLIEENKTNYKAINFEEPLPIHIEYGGILESCNQCILADRFLIFLLRPKAQQILMTKNYMYPVINGVADNTPFDTANTFKGIMVHSDKRWLEIWKSLQRNGQ
jgi:thiamine transport system substrate-binding protein